MEEEVDTFQAEMDAAKGIDKEAVLKAFMDWAHVLYEGHDMREYREQMLVEYQKQKNPLDALNWFSREVNLSPVEMKAIRYRFHDFESGWVASVINGVRNGKDAGRN